MIYLAVFFTLIMISIGQVGLFYSFKKQQTINAYLKLPQKSYIPHGIFLIFTITYFVFLFVFLKQTTVPQPNALLIKDEKIATHYQGAKQGQDTIYRQLEHEEFPKEENYYFLYFSADTSQKTLTKTALYLKKNLCKKSCTINFYDNIHAYILDRSRVNITSDSNMQTWNDENYIFVANHYLGYLSFNQPSFSYFPFEDNYYTKLLQK